MLSFWEKNSFVSYDVVIVGAGIVGLSTAAVLLERKPGIKILVLERGLLPSGASTKNAGFACFGSLTEILADVQANGAEMALQLLNLRYRGLGLLRKRLGDTAIDYIPNGGYELLNTSLENWEEKRLAINGLLNPIFNANVFEWRNEAIKTFGFNPEQVKALLYNPFEGQIDSGKMMRALYHYVLERGAMVLTGAEVKTIEENNATTNIVTENLNFQAAKVALCTNAFSRTFFPDWDIQPGRGQVLITEPIPGLRFKGCFHVEEGFYYFRDYYNRVLFGGGRNLDFITETTTDFGLNTSITEALDKYLNKVILPGTQPKIDCRWSGIMAFGAEKMPIIQQVSDRIVAGVRMGGMGVAIGSQVAESLADLILEESF